MILDFGKWHDKRWYSSVIDKNQKFISKTNQDLRVI